MTKLAETSYIRGDSAVFSSKHFLSSIRETLGLLLGSLLAPKMAQTSLGIPLGPAQSRSRRLFFGPRAAQDRSKKPPRPLQEAFRRPRSSKKPPGSHRFGAMLELLWTQKPTPQGLQTTVCVSVERHLPALQSSVLAKLRWAGLWRACAD